MGNVPTNHTVWAADNGTWQNDLPLAVSFISFASIFIVMAVLDMCLFCVCVGNEWHRTVARYGYHVLEIVVWIVAFSLFIAYFETGNKASKAYVHDGCADIALRGCNMSSRVVIVGSLFFVFTLATLVYQCVTWADAADQEDVSTIDAIRGLSCFGCCDDRDESGMHKKNDMESQPFNSYDDETASNASTDVPIRDRIDMIPFYESVRQFREVYGRMPNNTERAELMRKHGPKN